MRCPNSNLASGKRWVNLILTMPCFNRCCNLIILDNLLSNLTTPAWLRETPNIYLRLDQPSILLHQIFYNRNWCNVATSVLLSIPLWWEEKEHQLLLLFYIWSIKALTTTLITPNKDAQRGLSTKYPQCKDSLQAKCSESDWILIAAL